MRYNINLFVLPKLGEAHKLILSMERIEMIPFSVGDVIPIWVNQMEKFYEGVSTIEDTPFIKKTDQRNRMTENFQNRVVQIMSCKKFLQINFNSPNELTVEFYCEFINN